MEQPKTPHPPRLEQRFLVVRACKGGIVYYPTADGFAGPLSDETWSAVPLSPDIVMALNEGSVEQQVAADLAPAPRPGRREAPAAA
jgi:hypothetical protein